MKLHEALRLLKKHNYIIESAEFSDINIANNTELKLQVINNPNTMN